MRKEWKKQARARMKKCYWMMVVLCLIMAFIKLDYSSSLSAIRTDTTQTSGGSVMDQVTSSIIKGDTENSNKLAQDYIKKQEKQTKQLSIIAIGHSRGVMAQLVNGVSSGDVLNTIYNALNSITKSKSVSIGIFVILSLLFVIAMKVFVFNIFYVTVKRIALELGLYDKVPMKRFLYLLRVRRIGNVVATTVLADIYQMLWTFTVIGGVIKSFSYQMVPYIMAENPSIKPNQAITLSRRMMDGHKWEAFKLNLSFIGWTVLELCTFGISGILFSNPYKEMTKAEYYRYIRCQAKEKEIPDAELLNDEYLYSKAEDEAIQNVYKELVDKVRESEVPVIKHSGIRGFMENVFGIILFYDEDEKEYQEQKAKQIEMYRYREILAGNMYPFRLFSLRNRKNLIKLSSVEYDRHYSILTLIFIFFSMSFIGWCWEVSLHLIADGVFVNRGIYHGPWLPIYGFGGVLILIFLYKFREKPFLEFFSAVVLCGGVEYFTAWYLETTHGGTKWWDYTGYFLNIHGRICAEGLLVFGLGGLAIVYLLAPFLDNHFRRIPKKIAIIVALVLMISYVGDGIYSNKHPNTGEGITNYTGEIEIDPIGDSIEYVLEGQGL